jgi:hypothetical protein
MERMWFYAKGSERKGPLPEAELRTLIQKGDVSSNDLAWTEGMSNWAPIYSLPDLAGGTAAPAPEPVQHTPVPAQQVASHSAAFSPAASSDQVALPDGLAGWTGFVGIITIVSGVFNALSCIGVLFGIFQIIAGVALMGAKTALVGVDTVPASLDGFFQKMKTFMQMTGIFYIVMLVMMVIFVALYATIFAAAISGAMGGMPR